MKPNLEAVLKPQNKFKSYREIENEAYKRGYIDGSIEENKGVNRLYSLAFQRGRKFGRNDIPLYTWSAFIISVIGGIIFGLIIR